MIQMTKSDYAYLSEDSFGVCIQCGAEIDGIEPDARRYECPECGHLAVYGLEEALLIGQIEFVDEE